LQVKPEWSYRDRTAIMRILTGRDAVVRLAALPMQNCSSPSH
jgi:hypothetical protein